MVKKGRSGKSSLQNEDYDPEYCSEEDDDIDLGEDDFDESNADTTVDGFTIKNGRPVQFGTDEYFENTKEKQGAKVELDPRYI